MVFVEHPETVLTLCWFVVAKREIRVKVKQVLPVSLHSYSHLWSRTAINDQKKKI